VKRKGFSASPAQQAKVRDQRCVECGMPGCDPAHLVPRSLGGCDDEACVIALCRRCHRKFDEHGLDLEPVLALSQFARERAHMASHMSFARCIQRLRGQPP
jgi:hypothetical protein